MTRTESPSGVIDTNVLLSSFLSRTSTAFVARLRLGESHAILRSSETEEELGAVIRRSKFDRYLSLPDRLELLQEFLAASTPILVTERIRACRDSRDDKFLELAVTGGADYILTGDADLLALHPFRGVAILTPAAYLASVGEVR